MSLVERIAKSFSKVIVRNKAVKVPELKIKNVRINENKQKTATSAIELLVRNAIKEAKEEKETKKEKEFVVITKEAKEEISIGYGAVSRNYASPANSYLDYSRVFGHLGKFRARGMYQPEGPFDAGRNLDAGNGVLVQSETMDKGARHVRYFMKPGSELDVNSLVPVAGMDSAEWENFKLWMKLDPVMYRFKTSVS